jgi:hypothetical protein
MAERVRKGWQDWNGFEATCSVLDRKFILGNVHNNNYRSTFARSARIFCIVSLRAVLSRKDTGTVWRSSLQACEGIAHLHLQQVQVSSHPCPARKGREDRRLAMTPNLVAAGSRAMI